MSFLSAFGEFPEMLLGLASGFGFALLLGFLSLRLLLGLMTRQQVNAAGEHNEINDSGGLRSLIWRNAAVGKSTAPDLGSGTSSGGAVSGPYLLPAEAPNRFARLAESGGPSSARVVELP